MEIEGTAAGMEATKKVYVHFEGKPEYTHVARITWGLTAEELASEFTRAYNAKHGRVISLDPATIRLLNGKQLVSKSANLIRLVKDRSDIFVERELPSSTQSVHLIEKNSSFNDDGDAKLSEASLAMTPATGELAPSVPDQQEQSRLEAELVSAVKNDGALGHETEEPVIRRALEDALKIQKLKQYKLAGSMFSMIVGVLPKQRICLLALGSMSLAVHNYAEALPWLQRGVAEYPLDAIFHARLADTYAGLGKYNEAIRQYDLALGLTEDQKPGDIVRKDGENLALPDHATGIDSQENHFERKSHNSRLLDDPSAGDVLGPVTHDGLKISSAEVFGKCGEGDLANVILQDTSLDSSEQQLIAAGDITHSLEETDPIFVSKPLLSFCDDLLLLSAAPSTYSVVKEGSVAVPAILPFEKKRCRIFISNSSPQSVESDVKANRRIEA